MAENAGHEYGQAIPQNGIVTKRDVFLRGERALSVYSVFFFSYIASSRGRRVMIGHNRDRFLFLSKYTYF